jgi:hypothetical protein
MKRWTEQMTQDCREHAAELQVERGRLQGWRGRSRVMRVEGEGVMKRQAGPVQNGVTLQMQAGQKGPEVRRDLKHLDGLVCGGEVWRVK